MKWIGQHIWDFITRFRSDVYLEATETGTIASGGNLGLDSNNKIVKAAEVGSSVDLTSEVTGVLPVANGGSGASTLLNNAVLTGTGTSAITAESDLIYNPPQLTIGNDSDTVYNIRRSSHSDGNGGGFSIYAGSSTGSGATNASGGDLNLYGGRPTGTGLFGAIQFYMGQRNTGSGSTLRASDLSARLSTSNTETVFAMYSQGGSSAGDGDSFSIVAAENGSSTISTTDAAGGSAANLRIAPQGKLTLSPADLTGDVFHLNAASDTDNIVNIDAGVLDIDTTSTTTITSAGLVKFDGGAGVEIENGAATGVPALTIDNNDVDEIALVIEAANTTQVVQNVDARALTTGAADYKLLASLETGAGLFIDFNDTFTTNMNRTTDGGSMIRLDYDKTGDVAGSNIVGAVGIDLDMNDGATNNAGSMIMHGMHIDINSASTNGTASNQGIKLNVTGGDINRGIEITCEDGGTDLIFQSSANNLDYCTFKVGEDGEATWTTSESGGGSTAHYNINADGDINLTSASNKISKIYDFHSTTFENTYSDSEGSGTILKYSPGANDNLLNSVLVYLHTDGTWDGARSTAVATGASQLLGVSIGGYSQTVGVFIKGFIRIPYTQILNIPGDGAGGGGAVDGLPLYVSSTVGHIDFNAPASGYVRIVGYAIDGHDEDGDSDEGILIYFDPDKTWIEIA